MCESTNVEKEEKHDQKPARSRARIAGQILAAIATGLAVALPVAYAIGSAKRFQGCFGGIGAAIIILHVCPLLYGPASALGVYLVGNAGRQTGSFLKTLGCGLLGGLLDIGLLYISLRLQVILTADQSSSVLLIGLMIQLRQIVQWVLWAFVLLIPPIAATYGFNMTRRYKEPRSSQGSGGKYFVSYR